MIQILHCIDISQLYASTNRHRLHHCAEILLIHKNAVRLNNGAQDFISNVCINKHDFNHSPPATHQLRLNASAKCLPFLCDAGTLSLNRFKDPRMMHEPLFCDSLHSTPQRISGLDKAYDHNFHVSCSPLGFRDFVASMQKPLLMDTCTQA